MYLVEILLPADKQFAPGRRALAHELADRFGGLTAFNRSPAKGLFQQHRRKIEDDIIIFEIQTDALEKDWWAALRVRLESDFQQDEILMRATAVERL
jgi:hypothetical protein